MSDYSTRLRYSEFNIPTLLKHASQLGNSPCSYDATKQPKSGNFNSSIFLSFEDGKEWVFRRPTIEGCGVSLEAAGALLESEVATMKYIKSHSSIPIPDVFDYSSTEANPIGMPFILMSKAPGTQLQDFDWGPNSSEKGTLLNNKSQCLTETEKKKIMRQLGVIASQLLSLRFNKIGSLIAEAGDYYIGKCLSPAFIYQERDTLGDDIPRGPFENDNEYYKALLSAFHLHVKELPLLDVFFAPIPELKDFKNISSKRTATLRWNDFVTVGAKIDSAKNRLDYYTVGQFLQRMIPSINGKAFAALKTSEDRFPLYHPDLSAGNIFVDEDLNITNIIDWAGASTVPITTLLMPPGLPYPRDEIDLVLYNAFKSGFLDHHFDRNYGQLASKVWEHTRRAWLFTRLVLLDGSRDYHHFKELYISVYKPNEEVNLSSLFKTEQRQDHLIRIAKELAEYEDQSDILKKEVDYFAAVGRIDKLSKGRNKDEVKLLGIGKHTIARKITLASELSEDFVVDNRLWRWIEEAMRERDEV